MRDWEQIPPHGDEDAPGYVPRGTIKANGHDPDPPSETPTFPPRELIDWPALQGHPPAREWIVDHWIPSSRDTLLAGKGGIGKTLLAQCMCTALSQGFDYVGMVEKPRRTLLWAGEDDADELWRRQININNEMKIGMADLKENFHAISYANADITLAAQAHGVLGPLRLMEELREQVNDLKIDVVWLDNIARIYGGNENDRHQVTQFMAWLRSACAPAAIVLLSHPAKAQGSEYSGSTAWEGAVRARLWLSTKPPDQAADEEEEADDAVRYLSRRKANYSANDMRRMVLINGVLVPDKAPEQGYKQDGRFSPDMAKDVVKRAIIKLTELSIFGNAGTRSPDYLPKLAQQYQMLDGLSTAQFGAAMRAMIVGKEVMQAEVGQYQNRTPKIGLKLA